MKDKFGPFQDKNVHEDNIHLSFWKVIEELRSGKSFSGDVAPFVHVGAKYVRGEGVPLIDITPIELANLLLSLFWDRPELKVFLKEAKSPPLIFALSQRVSVEKLKEWLRDEELKDIALDVLEVMGRDILGEVKDELLKIAQREVGGVQHKALRLLQHLAEEKEVKELFLSFLDDWDKEVRKLSAIALAKVKDAEVKERAKEVLDMENDPYIAFLMKRLTKDGDE